MKNIRNIILFACLLTSVCAFAAWQLPVYNYPFTVYNGGTQNWQVRQQKNGWMYFANNYGLLEFDGNEWSLYGIWNSTVIRSVEIAPDGSIYVGGSNEFGRFTSNTFGSLSYEPLSLDVPEPYKNFGEIWNIHLIHNTLYLQSRNYIFKKDLNSGSYEVIEPKSRIYCSAKIRDGLFVATASDIFLVTGNQLNALQGSEQLRGYEIRSLQPLGDNSILIGTDFNGLFIFNGNEIKPFRTDADAFIKANQLYSMAINEKYIAIGTVLKGLVIMDLSGKKCQYLSTENGLQNNTILSMSFDAGGNLWMGLDQGIDKVIVNSSVRQLYNSLNSKGAGYSSLIDGHKLYVGTNQGLYYTDYPISNSSYITDLQLVEGSMGQVWEVSIVGGTIFCCHNRGLFTLEDRRLKILLNGEGFWRIRQLPGNEKIVIAGSYSGFYVLKQENGKFKLHAKLQNVSLTAKSFEIDTNNRIWVITDKGLERLTLNAEMNECSSELLLTRLHDHEYLSLSKLDDRIIVSSNLAHEFEGKISGEVRNFVTDKSNNLSRDSVFFNQLVGEYGNYVVVTEDDCKNIWFISDRALYVSLYDEEKGHYKQPSIRIWNSQHFFIDGFAYLYPIGNGQLMMGCLGGFAMADVNNVPISSERSRYALIKRIYSTSPKDSVVYGQSYPIRHKDVRIAYKNNSIRVEFGAAANFNEVIEYRCRLVGYDDGFSAWTRNTVKEYTSLPEGKYTFKLQARNNMNPTLSNAEVTFYVLPPWYRSWWGYCIWLVLAAYVLFIIYRYFMRKVERSKRALERMKDEEMRQQEQKYKDEAHQREKEILRLKNEQIAFELKNKSQELSNVLLNHLNKNEMVKDIKHDLAKIGQDLKNEDAKSASKRLVALQSKLTQSIEQEINWEKFTENFDLVNDNYLRRLGEHYPWMNSNERRLCVYIKMGLQTKEIAPILNLSIRGVEMLRYRMRKKMHLQHGEELELHLRMFMDETKTGEADTK